MPENDVADRRSLWWRPCSSASSACSAQGCDWAPIGRAGPKAGSSRERTDVPAYQFTTTRNPLWLAGSSAGLLEDFVPVRRGGLGDSPDPGVSRDQIGESVEQASPFGFVSSGRDGGTGDEAHHRAHVCFCHQPLSHPAHLSDFLVGLRLPQRQQINCMDRRTFCRFRVTMFFSRVRSRFGRGRSSVRMLRVSFMVLVRFGCGCGESGNQRLG
jgi:hypothetical protein